MRTIRIITTIVASMGLAAAGCLWWFFSLSGRHLGAFDLGGGRTLIVWSKQDRKDWPAGPTPIYYRIEGAGQPRSAWPYYLGNDHGSETFKSVRTRDGRLVCVYEPSRPLDGYLMVIFETTSDRSWPRDGPTSYWRERYEELRNADASLPTVDCLR